MADVDVAAKRPFDVPADSATTWALLADTRATLAHYPKLDSLVEFADSCWRWELQPIGIKGVSHQVVYSVRYEFDETDGTISWTPLQADTDNARIGGRFDIVSQAHGTRVVLSVTGTLDIPAPKFLIGAVKPLVEREFNQQIEGFVTNLTSVLSG